MLHFISIDVSLNDILIEEAVVSVKVSSKYQVVIPQEVRKNAHIHPGQEVEVMAVGEQVVIVPVKGMKEMRGMFTGTPMTGYRDKKDRF